MDLPIEIVVAILDRVLPTPVTHPCDMVPLLLTCSQFRDCMRYTTYYNVITKLSDLQKTSYTETIAWARNIFDSIPIVSGISIRTSHVAIWARLCIHMRLCDAVHVSLSRYADGISAPIFTRTHNIIPISSADDLEFELIAYREKIPYDICMHALDVYRCISGSMPWATFPFTCTWSREKLNRVVYT